MVTLKMSSDRRYNYAAFFLFLLRPPPDKQASKI